MLQYIDCRVTIKTLVTATCFDTLRVVLGEFRPILSQNVDNNKNSVVQLPEDDTQNVEICCSYRALIVKTV